MGKDRSCRGAEISPELRAPGRPKLYGRRRSHKLRPQAARLLAGMLPLISIPHGQEPIDPDALFSGHCQEFWLEIGFGDGGHLACQARANPQTGFIGCEVYENGVTNLLAKVQAEALGNIRICHGDARLLLPRLPPACLSLVFLLFPDPWPKRRQHKRRFIGAETLDALARVMRSGAELRFASDCDDYCCAALEAMQVHGGFGRYMDDGDSGYSQRQPDWPPTKYEGRALEQGGNPRYLRFLRR